MLKDISLFYLPDGPCCALVVPYFTIMHSATPHHQYTTESVLYATKNMVSMLDGRCRVPAGLVLLHSTTPFRVTSLYAKGHFIFTYGMVPVVRWWCLMLL